MPPRVMPPDIGLPCWDPENIRRVIGDGVAQLGEHQRNYFLVSHAPIEHILREKDLHGDLGEDPSEEALFAALLLKKRGSLLAAVSGEPGSGKSHLIHWLHLRCDHELHAGRLSKNVVPVLIARGNGSLKDALEQMIPQVPESCRVHLEPVKNALVTLEEDDARRRFALSLAAVMGTRSFRDRLPRTLQALPDAPAAPGFRDWLCRDGRTVSQIVSRLVAASSVDDRMNLPEFNRDDVTITDDAFGGEAKNPGNVRRLISDIREDEPPGIADKALAAMNEARQLAIAQFTGLGATVLRDVLVKIRRQLAKENRSLAVFIEDVSTLSVLDSEVFLAFDYKTQDAREKDLCEMVAVLGMVDAALQQIRQRENQMQRLDMLVSVGGRVDRWREDEAEVERFVARYLNAVRLPVDAVRQIAEARNEGHDVTRSACDGCKVREGCHAAFGATSVGDVKIGLFPLAPGASRRMLNALDTDAAGVRRNQRGLLNQVVAPVLRDHDALQRRQFPQALLTVERVDPAYWDVFVAVYCRRLNAAQKAAVKRLAQHWIPRVNGADEAARLLRPLCEALGLALEEGAGAGTTTDAGAAETKQTQDTETEQPTDNKTKKSSTKDEEDPLEELRKNLTHWIEHGRLSADERPRQLLADFVRSSFNWTDQMAVPPTVWRRMLWNESVAAGDDADDVEKDARPSSTKGRHGFIAIDGMASRPAMQTFVLKFDRSDETRQLIDALARFDHHGSWSFPEGEHYKHIVARWQRKHAERVYRSLQPVGVDDRKPLDSATEFLSAAAVAVRQQPLPDDPAALIDALFNDPRPSSTSGSSVPGSGTSSDVELAPAWRTALQFLRDEERHRTDVRQFLLGELDVPQGNKARRTIVINPVPLVRAVAAFRATVQVRGLDNKYNVGFWQPRYNPILNAIAGASGLTNAIGAERKQIAEKIKAIAHRLAGFGRDAKDLDVAVAGFGEEVGHVLAAMKIAKFDVPDDGGFDQLRLRRPRLKEAGEHWAAVVASADAAARGSDMNLLAFEPRQFLVAAVELEIVFEYLDSVEVEVKKREDDFNRHGDPLVYKKQVIDAVEAMARG